MKTIDTRRLVDPDLIPLIDAMPTVPLTPETMLAARAQRAAGASAALEGADDSTDVRVERVSIPGIGHDPDVNAVLHAPKTVTGLRGAILHLHGGGFIMGDPYGLISGHREMATALGCVILSVDYRLAPETRFPGAIHDAYAALTWLFSKASELNLDTSRIGVMGESAGGGLAAALALLTRDKGEYPLAFQHLIYPMLDDRTGVNDEPNAHAGEFIWTRESNRFGWEALLGHTPGGEDVSPYAAPARADDLTKLPPTFICTGALDLFVDEDIAFAHRLIRSGVPTELHVYAGAYHGFHLMPQAAVTLVAFRDSLDSLRRAMAPPTQVPAMARDPSAFF